MSFYLIIGPQYSGKTEKMITYVSKLVYSKGRKLKHAYFKKKSDNRYSNENIIMTNSKIIQIKKNVISLNKSDDILKYINKYDIFAIEELHFWKDIRSIIFDLLKAHKYIIATTLKDDFKQKMFKEVIDSIPLATNIKYMYSYCSNNNCGKKAHWTVLVKDSLSNQKKLILSAGIDTFQPRCLGCLLNNKY